MNIKKEIKYTIAIDWLQFSCTYSDMNKTLDFNSNTNASITYKNINDKTYILEQLDNSKENNNPNFRYVYNVYHPTGGHITTLYSVPLRKHIYNEDIILVKVANPLLYSNNMHTIITEFIIDFKLSYKKLNRLDIAIDSTYNSKAFNFLRRISKEHYSIVLNNQSLNLDSSKFDFNSHRSTTFKVGKQKSGLMAVFYNKSKEIIIHNKSYIRDFWIKNGLPTDSRDIYRIEFRFFSKRLNRLNYTFDDLEKPETITDIITKEIKEKRWLDFYEVSAKANKKGLRKDKLIAKGRKKIWIYWNRLPHSLELNDNPMFNTPPTNNNKTSTNDIKTVIRTLLKHLKWQLFINRKDNPINLDIIKELTYNFGNEKYTRAKIEEIFDLTNPEKRNFSIYINECSELINWYDELYYESQDNDIAI